MDLTQLAKLGEFIGGVAVLVTLIYLALQVRDGTNEQRMAASREATRELASVLKTIVTTPEQAELFMAALGQFDRLEGADRLRISAILSHLLRLFEQLFYQQEAGRVDAEVWQGYEHQLHDMAAYPGFKSWWPTRSHWYGTRFRTYFESHMSEDNQPRRGYGLNDRPDQPS